MVDSGNRDRVLARVRKGRYSLAGGDRLPPNGLTFAKDGEPPGQRNPLAPFIPCHTPRPVAPGSALRQEAPQSRREPRSTGEDMLPPVAQLQPSARPGPLPLMYSPVYAYLDNITKSLIIPELRVMFVS